MDAYTLLEHVLYQLWGLWELLVLGEPLLVAAPTPGKLACPEPACCDPSLCLCPPGGPFNMLITPQQAAQSCFMRFALGIMHYVSALAALCRLYIPLSWVSPALLAVACSGAVAALLSLLAPFPYAADFRPYLTIHDPCFAKLAAGALPTPANGLPCLLGVTNLYFIKALPAWPNVLSTGYGAQQRQQQQHGGGSGEDSNNGSDGGGGMGRSESGQSFASSSGSLGASGAARGSRLGQALRRRAQGPQVLLSEAHDALWMTYKPSTRPDKEVLGRLARPRPTGAAANQAGG